MTSSIREQLFVAFYVLILFTLESLVDHIPNVQLTTLLFLILFENNDKTVSALSIVYYVVLQGLMWGFGSYILGMYIGWFLYMIIAKIFIKTGVGMKAFISLLFAFIYGLSFYPMTGIIYQIPFATYMVADFPYALIMGVSNFISILWLYPKTSQVVKLLSKSHEVRL